MLYYTMGLYAVHIVLLAFPTVKTTWGKLALAYFYNLQIKTRVNSEYFYFNCERAV